MTKAKRSLAYVAEYEFADDNLLTATYHEETRIRNKQRVRHAHSVLAIDVDEHTVNNAKKLQQERDRNSEISLHNSLLLSRLERIHKKLPKRFDVSHHSEELLSAPRPSNLPSWQREQDRIAMENRKMKRRLNQTKASFDTKQLRVDADRHRYFADQISKAERRMQVKQQCMQLEGRAAIKRLGAEAEARSPSNTHHHHDHHHRKYDVWDVEQVEERLRENLPECQPDKHRSRRLSLLSHRVADKYVESQASSPTVTTTTKLIRAADLLPRLGRVKHEN